MITGASDGIGRALAIETARLGAQVVLHGRNSAKLEKVYDQIDAMDGTVRPSIVVLDLVSANADNYTTLANSIDDEFGRLDGLVHNAAIIGDRFSIEQYDAVVWQRVMHVNVTAGFALTQVLLPMLHQSDDASVIFTVAALDALDGLIGGRTLHPSLRLKACRRYSPTNIKTASCGRTVLTPVPPEPTCVWLHFQGKIEIY